MRVDKAGVIRGRWLLENSGKRGSREERRAEEERGRGAEEMIVREK